MARKQARPLVTKHATLDLLEKSCRACGHRLLMARHSHRKVTRLDGVYDLRIKVYQCLNRECPRLRQMCRPEEEGSWALPHGEFGLDVIALVGALRYREQHNIPQIHQELLRRGLQVAQRSVTDQLYRYEELLAVSLADRKRLKERLKYPICAADLQLTDVSAWRALRQSLDYRHEGRRCLLRFRRDPLAYFSALELSLLTPCLPP